MMGTALGGSIFLGGEKEYTAAIKNINSSLRVLSSESEKVSSAYDKNDKSTAAVKARHDVLSKTLDAQKEKIKVLSEAVENSNKKYTEAETKLNDTATAYKSAKDKLEAMKASTTASNAEIKAQEKAVSGLAGELGKAEKGFNSAKSGTDKLQTQLNKAKADSKKTADEMQNLGKKTEKAGNDAKSSENKWGGLSSALSKVGSVAKAAFAATGTAIAGTATALSAASVSAASYSDNILTLSSQTGISTDQLEAYNYAAELVDVSTETMTKSMAKNIKSMTSAAKGTGDATQAYKKLGISVTDGSGKLRDGQTVYWEAIDALGKISDETERDSLSMQIFGKSAQDLNPLIAQGSAGMKNLTEEAKNAGAVMGGKSLEALGKFDDSIQRLKSSSSAAKNAIGTALLPQLTMLTTSGTAIVQQFTKSIVDANGDVGKMAEAAGTAVSSAMETINTMLPQITAFASQIIVALVTSISENLPQIIDSAISICSTLLQALIDNLPTIIQAGLGMIDSVVSGLLSALPQLISAALEVIKALASGLAQSLPEMIPTLVDTVLYIVDQLIDNVDMLVDASIQIIMALADGLITAMPRLVSKAPEIITKLVGAIIRNAPKLISASWQIMMELGKGLIANISGVLSNIPAVINQIIGGFGDVANKVWDVGKNIVSGIWNGISGSFNWLKDKISGWCNNVVGSIKNFLGIHSPSRVMRDSVGVYMAQGLGEGFSDAMPEVTNKMRKAIPTNLSAQIGVVNGHDGVSAAGSMEDSFVRALNRYGLTATVEGTSATRVMQPLISKQSGFAARRVMA